jgi:hypothetical protein
MWQDWVLMVGGFLLTIALFPTLFGKRKPEYLTSMLSGSILLTFGFVYATLNLWLAFIPTITNSIIWFILAIQVSRR